MVEGLTDPYEHPQVEPQSGVIEIDSVVAVADFEDDGGGISEDFGRDLMRPKIGFTDRTKTTIAPAH